ncbi:MAG: DUF5667 domain-containing protein [Nocardioidaceae bacterium]
MTTLFRPSRRAEEFALRVDGASNLRAADDTATEQLVGLTQLLRVRGAADTAALPRADFALDLRERLMTEAAAVLTPSSAGLALPVRARGKRERRLVAIASAAVLLGGTAGMATAAQNALPGEALYPIKRGIEKAEVRLSLGQAGQGRDLLHQAGARLGEAQVLIDADSPTSALEVPGALAAFARQAQQGSDLLLASYADSSDPETVATVREFAADSLVRIEAMDPTAPPEARGDLRGAALALRDIDARANELCDSCADLPALAMPQVFLASAEVDRAIRRFEAAQPDNSHPVVAAKQDVRRADSGSTDSGSTGSTGKAGSTGGTTTTTGEPRPSGADTSDGDTAPLLPAAPQAPSAPTSGVSVPKVSGAPTGVPTVPVPTNVDPGAITDGLGDSVETILPDVNPTNLLP